MMKSILVTGASSGIGRAAALELSKPGHQLHLVARRGVELAEVANTIRSLGAIAHCHAQDLTQLDRIPELVAQAFANVEEYPVLVNCAGIGHFGPFSELSWDQIQHQIELNLLAPARLIHAALPIMLAAGGGQIINVLSMTCVHVLPGGGGYSTAKAGLQMLGKVVSREYRKKGIRVTNLMPGAVDTPIWEGSPMANRMSEMIPTAEVAKVIQQLVESPTSYNMDEILMMPAQGVL